MAEEEQEHLDRLPLAEPGWRNGRSNQCANHPNGGTFRFPILKTRNNKAGLALEGVQFGDNRSLAGAGAIIWAKRGWGHYQGRQHRQRARIYVVQTICPSAGDIYHSSSSVISSALGRRTRAAQTDRNGPISGFLLGCGKKKDSKKNAGGDLQTKLNLQTCL